MDSKMHIQVLKILDELKIPFKNFEHDSVLTVEEARSVDDSIDTMPTKNLFLKDKKKNYFLVTTYAYQDINIKSLAKQIGAKGGLSFAKAEDLLEYLNLKPGSVTPFGLIHAAKSSKQVKFFLHNKLYEAATIGIHPLRNDMTIVISPKDLEMLLNSLNTACYIIRF